MKRSIFETLVNQRGLAAIQTEACSTGIREGVGKNRKMVVLAWLSPYATIKRNQQLQRELKRAYEKYYIRVLYDNFGLFWNQTNKGGDNVSCI